MGAGDGTEGLDDAVEQGELLPPGSAEMQQWEDLLDSLMPDRTIVVKDCTGFEHTLNTAVPANTQLKLMRLLGQLYRMPAGAGAAFAEAIQAARGAETRMGGLMMALNVILQNDETSDKVKEILSDAFKLAHPEVTRVAVENVLKDERLKQYVEDPTKATIMDALDLTDVVSGLLPFGARLVRKVLPAARKMMALAPES